MKIALYYPWIYLKSGVERTILETVRGNSNEYTLFTNHFDPKGTYPEFKNLKIVKLKEVPVRRNIGSTLRAALIILFQKVDLTRFDLLLIHSEGLGDLFLIRNRHKKIACFCHTPLRPVFDPVYKKHAMNQRSFLKKPVYMIFNSVFAFIDRILWKKYDFIFFNSRETLKRAKKGKLLSKGAKYTVLHPGINWANTKPKWIYKKFFLVPGRIMWTKNVELAIKSFMFFSEKYKDKIFKLIIAGQVDQKSKAYLNDLKKLIKGNKNVSFSVNPTDSVMKRLYSQCYAAITMSFNEDWGITPLEANSYGKAVIASKKGGFTESQINGKTGFLVPLDYRQVAEKIHRLSVNIRLTKQMGREARTNCAKYDWKVFIEKYNNILEHV